MREGHSAESQSAQCQEADGFHLARREPARSAARTDHRRMPSPRHTQDRASAMHRPQRRATRRSFVEPVHRRREPVAAEVRTLEARRMRGPERAQRRRGSVERRTDRREGRRSSAVVRTREAVRTLAAVAQGERRNRHSPSASHRERSDVPSRNSSGRGRSHDRVGSAVVRLRGLEPHRRPRAAERVARRIWERPVELQRRRAEFRKYCRTCP